MAKKRVKKGKKGIFLKLTLAVAVLSVLLFAWLWQNDVFKKKIFYPFLYPEEIKKYSKMHKLSPSLVTAVIKNESRFKASAQSERGAIGLMQIMPDTAEWIAEQTDWQGFDVKLLQEPDINIRFGCWYLNELREEFKHEKIYVAAYNAGRGNVKEWLDENKWDGKTIENIPFEETRKYVENVMKDKLEYEKYYEDVK